MCHYGAACKAVNCPFVHLSSNHGDKPVPPFKSGAPRQSQFKWVPEVKGEEDEHSKQNNALPQVAASNSSQEWFVSIQTVPFFVINLNFALKFFLNYHHLFCCTYTLNESFSYDQAKFILVTSLHWVILWTNFDSERNWFLSRNAFCWLTSINRITLIELFLARQRTARTNADQMERKNRGRVSRIVAKFIVFQRERGGRRMWSSKLVIINQRLRHQFSCFIIMHTKLVLRYPFYRYITIDCQAAQWNCMQPRFWFHCRPNFQKVTVPMRVHACAQRLLVPWRNVGGERQNHDRHWTKCSPFFKYVSITRDTQSARHAWSFDTYLYELIVIIAPPPSSSSHQ